MEDTANFNNIHTKIDICICWTVKLVCKKLISINVLFIISVHEIRKKWSNLRTCFRRELNAQEYTKSGQAGTKRRKYIYFEQLLFLLPCVENHHKESNVSTADDEDDDETSAPRRKKACKPKQTSSDIDETLLVKTLDVTRDEDTYFALSLVPSLRDLSPEEKLDAKINILNVFKQIIMARRGETTFQAP